VRPQQAITENKTVQIALLGVLAVAAAIILMTRMSGGSAEEAPPSDASAVATAPGTATPGTAETAGGTGAGAVPPGGSSTASGVTSPTAPATSAGATAGSSSSVPTSAGSVSPTALVPGPGLPKNVIVSWARGDAIVLLIVRGGGTDDRLVRQSVEALSEPGVSVFVARAKDVARYSRITQGVGVSQVPALVVVHPRKVSGSTPQAEVSYGFRNSQAVVQAVHDALYTGRDDLPYSPR
jgi:hypothetical protein